MIRPSRQEFLALAQQYTVVPVWRELLGDLTTPVAAFARVGADERSFLLESVEGGERWSRWSFIGRRPRATLIARRGSIEVEGIVPASVRLDGGVLGAIESLLDCYRAPTLDGLPPLHAGLVGYFGYDVVREVEKLEAPPADELGVPDAIVSVVGQIVAYDAWRQRVLLIDSVFVEPGSPIDALNAAYDEAISRLDVLAREGAAPIAEPLIDPPERMDAVVPVRRRSSPDDYRRSVEAAKEHIAAGDIFQVVLAQRFDLDLRAEPFDIYRSLRQVNPSPYMYLLRNPECCLVGSSPEPLVSLLDGRVVSRPIAGTRKRGSDDAADRRLAAELSEHPKERAEHVMLVDLARNDVGRVVDYGTETVDEFMTLERYSHVMHLTSQVSGRLRAGLGPVDVLKATLPAGTVSGAPKVRAMEIIDSLEPAQRGPYAGVVGYLDFSGNLDTAIAIRTMVIDAHGNASVSAGAGVVADSDPADEDLECTNKAAALLAAVPGAERIATARRAAQAGAGQSAMAPSDRSPEAVPHEDQIAAAGASRLES